MIRNRILPAELTAYLEGYAVVQLPQYSGDTRDLTIEEVIVTNPNSKSQLNPKIGDKVLMCFDDFGDAYIIGVLSCQQQPMPDLLTPGETMVLDNGFVSITINGLGKFIVNNTVYELLETLVTMLTNIIGGTMTGGAGPYVWDPATLALLNIDLAKLTTFKE